MNRELLIANALVVSSKSCTPADILVSDGKIAALLAPGSGCEAKKVIDVKGRHVMPGCVAVSYTHLDVYKRQPLPFVFAAQFLK